MELKDCDSFVKRATAQFHQLAVDHGYMWESWKKHFWIRSPGRDEVFQGNFETNWLRGFMHDLQPTELQRLNEPVPYRNHNGHGDGHRFYIKDARDIDIVKAIVVARCG